VVCKTEWDDYIVVHGTRRFLALLAGQERAFVCAVYKTLDARPADYAARSDCQASQRQRITEPKSGPTGAGTVARYPRRLRCQGSASLNPRPMPPIRYYYEYTN
jgi:hypothetical protein